MFCEIASTSGHRAKGDALVRNEVKLGMAHQPEKEGGLGSVQLTGAGKLTMGRPSQRCPR